MEVRRKELKSMLVKAFREIADNINNGNCELSEQEMLDLIGAISHTALSKEQACSYLNLSRSRFDDLVREGKIPRGRKRRGFKELVWYKDELNSLVK